MQIGGREREGIEVALGIVEVMAGLRIDAADGAHHLGPEQACSHLGSDSPSRIYEPDTELGLPRFEKPFP